MNLLLDTCSFLWLVTADERLPGALRRTLRDPHNVLWLSVASLWEITIKHESGRLPLPDVPATLVPRARAEHGVGSLAIDEPAVQHLAKLPRIHRDPFDRLLVCQAIQDGLVIVTPDATIRAYPCRTLWQD